MTTTVTNTNPVSITGGTMAAGARATIYPNQIARSFKVVGVSLVAAAAGDTLVISDGPGTHTLVQLTANAANQTLSTTWSVPVTWADWKVTTLTSTADVAYVYLK